MDIEVCSLSKAYGDKIIFDDFSYRFESGTVTLLCGDSGKGKTTLLRILSGLESADKGQVKCDLNIRFSYVFQEDRLCENFTALQNIKAVLDKSSLNYSDNVILDAAKRLSLENDMHKKVSRLSGGMKRRVSLLRALLSESDVLLLDEPFTGLDADNKKKAIELICEMAEKRTIILAGHSEEDADLLRASLLKI